MMMMKSLRTLCALVAAAGCFTALPHPAQADTFTLTSAFDGTFDGTLSAPFVGSGSFSYTASSALADGSYDWDSFSNIALQLTIGGFTFTQVDLTTSSAQVNVEIRGGYFFFSNDNGGGNGGYNGSADFSNGGSFLTTEPYNPATGPMGGGPSTTPRYVANINGTTIQGTYGAAAVPEPSTFAFIVAGAALCGCVARRRTRRV